MGTIKEIIAMFSGMIFIGLILLIAYVLFKRKEGDKMNTGTCEECGKLKYLTPEGICSLCQEMEDRLNAEDREIYSRIAREIAEGRARVGRII